MGTPLAVRGEAPVGGWGSVLLAGGEIRDYRAVADRVSPGDYIVCADSGYDHCARLGVTPDLLVGDFDSLRAVPPDTIARVPLPTAKNHTDTTHALQTLTARGAQRILMAGMLGGRLDHTLANLQSLCSLSRRGIHACITDGLTDIHALTGEAMELLPRARYYFSLLSLTQRCEGVNIVGARYLLRDYTLTFDEPRAVSNEFLASPVTVSVRSGTMAVLLVPMD